MYKKFRVKKGKYYEKNLIFAVLLAMLLGGCSSSEPTETNSGSYSDLTIWSWLAVIFSVILFVTVIVQKKKQKVTE